MCQGPGEPGARTEGLWAVAFTQGRGDGGGGRGRSTSHFPGAELQLPHVPFWRVPGPVSALGPTPGHGGQRARPRWQVGVGVGEPLSHSTENKAQTLTPRRARPSQLLSTPLWGDDSGPAERCGPVLLTLQAWVCDFLPGHGVTPPGHRSRCTHSAGRGKAPSLPGRSVLRMLLNAQGAGLGGEWTAC